MDMRCVSYDELGQYIADNEAFLLRDESRNNLILGRLGRMVRQPTDAPLLVTVKHAGSVLGQAIRTGPEDLLLLSKLPKGGVDCLIEHLFERGIRLSGVVGPRDTCGPFADGWSARNGLVTEIRMEQGVYELRSVIMPDGAGGRLVLAAAADRPAARPLLEGFVRECFPEEADPVGKVDKRLEKFIHEERLFLWEDAEGRVVAAAANSRETRNTACLSWVYTPPEHRGRGHASRVVAGASQVLLDRGATACNLFTDLTNATSNALYQRLGYQKIDEALDIAFTSTGRTRERTTVPFDDVGPAR